MNNEPVAWMFVLDGCRCVTLDEDAADEVRYNGTPLYTHPVKELTLSNTELAHMWKDAIRKAMVEDGAEHEYLAEAILRKASEK